MHIFLRKPKMSIFILGKRYSMLGLNNSTMTNNLQECDYNNNNNIYDLYSAIYLASLAIHRR